MEQNFLGIALWQYILGLTCLLGAFILKRILETLVFRKLILFFQRKTSFNYDEKVIEAIASPIAWEVLIGGLHLSIFILALNLDFRDWNFLETLKVSFFTASGIVAVWAFYRLADVFAEFLSDVASTKDPVVRDQFIPLFRKTIKVFVIIIGALTVLASLNVDVKGLLAGLGIGGLAVALAVKDTLANFFASLTVLADRPFKVGDWIIVGDKVDGNVEEIGFRSTKVRTWPKTLMTIPNSILANEIIDNWSMMSKRRVSMVVGVTYETTPSQMKALLEDIKKTLREDEGVNQEYMLVRFRDFGASSLDIFLYYFTKSIVWDEYLAVRERINLRIIELVKKHGTSIAFPTRTVYFEGDIAKAMARPPCPGQNEAGSLQAP